MQNVKKCLVCLVLLAVALGADAQRKVKIVEQAETQLGQEQGMMFGTTM